MKPYGTLGANFLPSTLDNDEETQEACSLCEAHTVAAEKLPSNLPCPHCGAALPFDNIAIDAAHMGGLTVVSETNGDVLTQRFCKLPVGRCDECQGHVALWPLPIIYNANHDVYYTGGAKYLPSKEMNEALDAKIGKIVEERVASWQQRREAGEPLQVWQLGLWIKYAAQEVMAQYLVENGFAIPAAQVANPLPTFSSENLGDPITFPSSDRELDETLLGKPMSDFLHAADDEADDSALHITVDKSLLRSMGGLGGLGQSFLSTFAMNVGAEFAKKAAQAKTRACPKCGAAAGEWCNGNVDGQPNNGKATVCRERLS